MDPLTIVFAIIAIGALLLAALLSRRSRPAPRSEIDPEALRALVADAVAHAADGARGDQDRPGPARHRAAGDPPPPGRPAAPAADAAATSDGAHGFAAPDGQTPHGRTLGDGDSVTVRDAAESRRAAAEMLTAARAERDRILDEARNRAAELERAGTDDRQRAEADSARKIAAARAEIAHERDAIVTATAALDEDRAAIAADRERLRADRADLARARADISAREGLLRQDTARLGEDQAALEAARLEQQQQADAARADQESELARLAGLTADEARAELLARQEDAVRRESALMIRRVEAEAQATAQTRARTIVADAISRVASDQTAQSVVTVVHLPSDDLKGRIIGREGRNIRTFETVTGVNVIIDDTPEAVLLSCFDPVRREIGRVTLQALIDDGRIHPHRIEEAYDRAQQEVAALCQRAAEDALLDVGISDLDSELVTYVGQLKYRTSYGQNVLAHSIETAHIARLMAYELGIDPIIVTRGAFLHDIGKALTHEAQGSHALVGADLARRHGECPEVVHCIEAHHDEVPPATVEAVLTQAADACSGGRPGARRESLESYVKRLEHIEAIAGAKKGVAKVFAMQAGRELRVMVKPEAVDDLEAQVMAREVAKQIEEELTYPGQVRVTVIRESRATEVAR